MAQEACELGIQRDELSDNVCNLKTLSKHTSLYQREAMSLDVDFWKEWDQIEKTMNNTRKQLGENRSVNKAKLVLQCLAF